MIAAKNQGKGYGKKAMLKALSIIRTRPHGQANAVVLSLDPDNEIVKKVFMNLLAFMRPVK